MSTDDRLRLVIGSMALLLCVLALALGLRRVAEHRSAASGNDSTAEAVTRDLNAQVSESVAAGTEELADPSPAGEAARAIATAALAARVWRIAWMDGTAPDAQELSLSGRAHLRIKDSSGAWRSCAVRVENGLLEGVPDDPEVDLEVELARLQLDVTASAERAGETVPCRAFPVDRYSFVRAGREPVVLRVAPEPFVSIRAASGEEVDEAVLAEACAPPEGVKPRFPHPGPVGRQGGRRTVPVPFPARWLSDYERPLVSAQGLAWSSVSPRVAEQGGSCILQAGTSVTLALEEPGEFAEAGLAWIDVVLYAAPQASFGYGLVATRWASAEPFSWPRNVLRFDGLPGAVRRVAALASDVSGAVAKGSVEVPAGALGARVVDVPMIREDRGGVVEGYLEIVDAELAARVQEIRLSAMDPHATPAARLGRRLALGAGLTREDEHVLHWTCEDLATGTYALLLGPYWGDCVGVHLLAVVEDAAGGAQTLYHRVPRSCALSVRVTTPDDRPVEGVAGVKLSSFSAEFGDERPIVFASCSLPVDASGRAAVRAPLGSRCRLTVVGAPAGTGAAPLEVIATPGGSHRLVVRALDDRRVRVRLVSGGEPVAEPYGWWTASLTGARRDGSPFEPRVVFPVPDDFGETDVAFLRWGTKAEELRYDALDVIVPAAECELCLASPFAAAGARPTTARIAPESTEVTIDVGLAVVERP